MARLLREIPWEEPYFETVHDPEWEADVRRVLGVVPVWAGYVSDCPWLRTTVLDQLRSPLRSFPGALTWVVSLVASQENGCRYCYGTVRSQLRILGFTDDRIERIERDAQLADEDERHRPLLRFCRELARSNPRPPRAEADKLRDLGLDDLAIAECAWIVSAACTLNRVTTFVAAPPEKKLERLTQGWLGALLRPVLAGALRKKPPLPDYSGETYDGPYARLPSFLAGSPTGPILAHALKGCFESTTLSRSARLMIFGVVARLLSCELCVAEARGACERDGMGPDAFDAGLASLQPSELPSHERRVLGWARDTVLSYDPADMQRKTRALVADVGRAVAIDAIGTAAFANGCVRLAMLAS